MEPGCILTIKEIKELQQELKQGIAEMQQRFPNQFRRELRTSRAALKGINEMLAEMKQMRDTA